MQTRIIVVRFFFTVLTLLSGAHAADKSGAVLSFDLRYLGEEKVLGRAWKRGEPRDPEFGEVATFISIRDLPHSTVYVYRDRDHHIVRYHFEFIRRDNGGNDPNTGRPWAMPATFVNACLRLFEIEWKKKSASLLLSNDGKVRAEISLDSVRIFRR